MVCELMSLSLAYHDVSKPRTPELTEQKHSDHLKRSIDTYRDEIYLSLGRTRDHKKGETNVSHATPTSHDWFNISKYRHRS